jgi:hypothetical protein
LSLPLHVQVNKTSQDILLSIYPLIIYIFQTYPHKTYHIDMHMQNLMEIMVLKIADSFSLLHL